MCSKLLQMSAHMPVPIIIVSQRKETKDVIGGLRRGAVDYIRKPFEAEEVLARLSTILRFHMMDLKQRRASAKQVPLLAYSQTAASVCRGNHTF